MLRIASERAAESGLNNLDFVEQDAETIDFPEGSFDAVLCRFALMFLADPLSAIDRMRTVLKEGGCLVAAVFGPPDRVPLASVAMEVIARELQLPPPAPVRQGCSR